MELKHRMLKALGLTPEFRADKLSDSQSLTVTSSEPSAGPGQLPPVEMPAAPSKPVALPSHKTQVEKQTAAIARQNRGLANTNIVNYRNGMDDRTIMRDLAASSPDLSSTRNSYLRVGIPERYTVLAREMNGAISRQGTELAQEILRRVTFLGDVTLGYNPVTDLQSLSESLAFELTTYGAMGLELALSSDLSPTFLQPVSVTKVKFREEDGGVYPFQEIGGEEFSLDIPTFFYMSVDQDLLEPYATSMFEASIQAVLADSQFLNDLRRAMTRAIQPRLVAKLIEDRIVKAMDPAIAADPDAKLAYTNSIIDGLKGVLDGLGPDDALVTLDSVEVSVLTGDAKTPIGETLSAVQKLLESKLAAGSKSNSAVLGRQDNGTSATTSTMLFVKNADIIRRKLNVLYSRMLTTACRLQGVDVFVEFRYDDIDLRPQGELEAYKAMKQSRTLELLSLGLIDDETACVELTGNLPPPGMKRLSGTMFTFKRIESENPDSQTSNMNKGGAKDNIKPNTPAAPKGKQ
jgi:hypothetical protein